MRLRRLSGIKEHGSGGTHRVAGAGLGLQHGAAAALDLACAGREPDEKGIDVREEVLRPGRIRLPPHATTSNCHRLNASSSSLDSSAGMVEPHLQCAASSACCTASAGSTLALL